MTNKKIIFTIFIAISFLLALSNSLIVYLDYYSTFSWVLDYRFGFCKRGMLGFLYHSYLIMTGSEFDFETLQSSMFSAHILLSFISGILLLILFLQVLKKCSSQHEFGLFCIYFFLICSFFTKNIFSLTGYIDLWIYNFFLIILLLLARNHLFSAIAVATASCFFTELSCVFWWSILVAYIIKRNLSKQSLLLTIPLIAGVFIHSFRIPVDRLMDFYNDFSFPITNIIQEGMGELFNNQYNLQQYIPQRLGFLANRFGQIFGSLLILGGILFIYYTYSISLLSADKQSLSKKIVSIVLATSAVFGALALNLVAIDFWRFVGFAVFASFIFFNALLIIPARQGNNTQNKDPVLTDKKVRIFRTAILSLGIAISVITLFTPPLRGYGTYLVAMTPNIFDYMKDNKSFVLNPYIYDNNVFFNLLAKYNFGNKNEFDSQSYNDITGLQEGNKFAGTPQTYGKTKIVIESIFDETDPDEFKYIEIYDKTLQIPKNATSEYYLELEPYTVAKYPSLIVNIQPSSSSWRIKKFEISKDE